MISRNYFFACCLVLICISNPADSQDTEKRDVYQDVKPVDAVDAVLDLFDRYEIVALGEGQHNNLSGATFRLELIRHPRFYQQVSDIVVEWGATKHQAVMDRYVNGKPVTQQELRAVWRDTANNMVWEAPIYREFFAAVRERNLAVPPDKRVRVLLGDSSIDWRQADSVVSFEQQLNTWAIKFTGTSSFEEMVEKYGDVQVRDLEAYNLIQREVLGKGRKALLVYGDMHFQRRNLLANYTSASKFTGMLVELIERNFPGVTFNVSSYFPHHPRELRGKLYSPTLEVFAPEILNWRRNSFVHLAGTKLGSADFRSVYPYPVPRTDARTRKLVPESEHTNLKYEQVFDGMIWLGTENDVAFSKATPDIMADEAVYLELLRRAEQGRGGYLAGHIQSLRTRYLEEMSQ